MGIHSEWGSAQQVRFEVAARRAIDFADEPNYEPALVIWHGGATVLEGSADDMLAMLDRARRVVEQARDDGLFEVVARGDHALTLADFLEFTGLAPDDVLGEEAYRDWQAADEPVAEWWADCQGDYV